MNRVFALLVGAILVGFTQVSFGMSMDDYLISPAKPTSQDMVTVSLYVAPGEQHYIKDVLIDNKNIFITTVSQDYLVEGSPAYYDSKNIGQLQPGEYTLIFIVEAYIGVFELGRELLTVRSFAPANWATMQGVVKNDDGQLVCAMALANGKYMFTCNPVGAYTLTVPLDSNGQIDMQVFAAGHVPFRKKLPSNQGYYDVVLEIADDSAPTTSSITIDVIDNCADGRNIDYKVYDTINNKVWPGFTAKWVTSGYGLKSSHTFTCENDGQVCVGARAGDNWWGVDLDGSLSCADCCLPCENKTRTSTLNCTN